MNVWSVNIFIILNLEMKEQELNQEQHLKIYQRTGSARSAEKEKICSKYINSSRKRLRR